MDQMDITILAEQTFGKATALVAVSGELIVSIVRVLERK